VSHQFAVGYSVLPAPDLSPGSFTLSAIPPSDSGEPFECELYDPTGVVRATVTARGGAEASAPIPLSVIRGGRIELRVKPGAQGEAQSCIAIDLSGDAVSTKLDRSNLSAQWMEMLPLLKPASIVPRVATKATNSPLQYYTGFEDHGVYNFLSYIPWLKRQWLPAAPPQQTSVVAHLGTYCCEMFENVLGESYLSSVDIDVPQQAYRVVVSCWIRPVRMAVGSDLTITIVVDGVPQKFEKNYPPPEPDGWCNVETSLDLPDGAQRVSFTIEFETTGSLGTIAYLDDLSVSFATEVPIVADMSARMNGGAISVPDANQYHFGTGEFSCEAWISGTAPGPVFGKTPAGSAVGPGFMFAIESNGVLAFYTGDSTGGTSVTKSGPTPALTGAWHHVAAARSNSDVTLYLDGYQSPGTTTSTKTPPLDVTNTSPLLIGSVQWNNYPNRFLRGSISEVRLWNQAQTPWSIADNLYLCASEGMTGLVGYWPFQEGDPNDWSSYHNDGTTVGFVIFNPGPGQLAPLTVGKYAAGGSPGVQYIGSHTFLAALIFGSYDSYPANVDVFFDAGGGHAPNQPSDKLTIDVLNVRGVTNDLILMTTGFPVGPTHPKKKEYGHNLVNAELCGLDLTGYTSRVGFCHQVVNRLLYAATWPHRITTMGDARYSLQPAGYWLTVAWVGVYGDPIVNLLKRGTYFKNWCAQIGFPTPPAEEAALHHSLRSFDSASRARAVNAIFDARRRLDLEGFVTSPAHGAQVLRNHLERAVGPELVRHFGLEEPHLL
jgi:hypothetical protein